MTFVSGTGKLNANYYGEKLTLVNRHFTSDVAGPYHNIEWERTTAEITGPTGEVFFRQEDVEFPKNWSATARNVVASKYFYGKLGSKERESSLKELVWRVADAITTYGENNGYFDDVTQSHAFSEELCHILATQKASFNSPVWFNIGTPKPVQQASACFILGVEDDMPSILNWYAEEGMIFKGGSGAGVNLSNIRSSREHMSAGGLASGPVSFMRGADASAGAIKSGGSTRRSAKMVVLDASHPDVIEFIRCKAEEERKAYALGDAGWDMSLNGEAWSSIQFQNANNSVRVSDAFMIAATTGKDWPLVGVDGQVIESVLAKDILHEMAQAAWECGDPGIQYDDTCNLWHTRSDTERNYATNPCCFVGETLVDTSEGKISFDQLMNLEELPLAFCYDTLTRLPALKKIKRVWKAGETRRLVEVTTDKGITVRCTPEHRFLLRNGEYVEAEFLSEGDRLRKIGRWINERRRHVAYINHRETPGVPNGTVIQSRFIWEQVYGPIAEGYDVHHINGDCTDDRLSNLELRQSGEHRSAHSAGSGNPRYLDPLDDQLLEVWEAVEATGKVTPTRWNSYVCKSEFHRIVPMAQSPSVGGNVMGMDWETFCGYMESVKDASNDRVASVSVIELDEPEAVFDLEVEGVHNFSVCSEASIHSIVVHNSEYVSINNSACNLASINLLSFLQDDGDFDWTSFQHTVEILITAMDILVGYSSYPTEKITKNANAHRELGLGYANLGALLMSMGMPYDSEEGRRLAAEITSTMTGIAYRQSTKMAQRLGPCEAYHPNSKSMIDVLYEHRTAAANDVPTTFQLWSDVIVLAEKYGVRNMQTTVIAPTGTIAFMMDCDTTGIEPAIALVSYKTLVGGGYMKLVNKSVRRALNSLGYSHNQVEDIAAHIEEHDTIIDAPHLREDDLPVFDCAFGNDRTITPMGHLLMMASVQPFVSGAISKTVNLPNEATVEDVEQIYIDGWKLGLKALAIYRDGSKRTQPLSTKVESVVSAEAPPTTTRRRLPDTRTAITHKFQIGMTDGYITVGLYEDGSPGELFINVSKQGSTISGLVDAWAIAVSMGLQHGVPLESFIDKFRAMRFDPQGITSNEQMRFVSSLPDYLAQWLEDTFVEVDETRIIVDPTPQAQNSPTQTSAVGEGPLCISCGSMTIRSGTCYTCVACGTTTGCS